MTENEVVTLIRQRFSGSSPLLKKGIGDDAAVIQPRGSRPWVLTADLLEEQVHFRRNWMTPEELGHKALAVNLSDVAAMGAVPRFYLVTLAVPRDVTKKWIVGFYRGLKRLGSRWGAVLIGGDLSETGRGIHISITAVGESVAARLLYRSGGTPGDRLYVTGVLGKSAAGLALLKTGTLRGRSSAEREALHAHRMPEPRCEVAAWLARQGWVRAAMDLSDGLSMDLPRLCAESGTGATIDGWRLPVWEESRSWRCDPRELALHGGEDYELLFAVPVRWASTLERKYPKHFPALTCVGELTGRQGIRLRSEPAGRVRPLRQAGFDHFRFF